MIPFFRDLYPTGLLHVCLPGGRACSPGDVTLGTEVDPKLKKNKNKKTKTKRGKSTNSLHWHTVELVKYMFDFMSCCAVEREGLILNERPQLISAASLPLDSYQVAHS